jgi:hypothetical protein
MTFLDFLIYAIAIPIFIAFAIKGALRRRANRRSLRAFASHCRRTYGSRV